MQKKLAEGKLFESGGTRVAACSEVLNLSAFFFVWFHGEQRVEVILACQPDGGRQARNA
jgi:hypothetical protein